MPVIKSLDYYIQSLTNIKNLLLENCSLDQSYNEDMLNEVSLICPFIIPFIHYSLFYQSNSSLHSFLNRLEKKLDNQDQYYDQQLKKYQWKIQQSTNTIHCPRFIGKSLGFSNCFV